MSVSALYVDPEGPYPRLLDDWWDLKRDARLYEGSNRVIAHPPCGAWSSLRHLYKGNDADCALIAVKQVRRCGGVLEHPAYSKLWDTAGLPKPGMPPDEFGGRTFEVNQCDWGHVARKKTWLYVVGRETLPPLPTPRQPTHWCSGTYTPGQRGTVPPGIKVCPPKLRRLTPTDFAKFLIEVAEGSSHDPSPSNI